MQIARKLAAIMFMDIQDMHAGWMSKVGAVAIRLLDKKGSVPKPLTLKLSTTN